MQKVEGSSPFSRFGKGPQRRAFCLPELGSAPGRLPKPSPKRRRSSRRGALRPGSARADCECRVCRWFGSAKRSSGRPRRRYLRLGLPSWEHGGTRRRGRPDREVAGASEIANRKRSAGPSARDVRGTQARATPLAPRSLVAQRDSDAQPPQIAAFGQRNTLVGAKSAAEAHAAGRTDGSVLAVRGQGSLSLSRPSRMRSSPKRNSVA